MTTRVVRGGAACYVGAMDGFELVCCMALSDAQVRNHLAPVVAHPAVQRVWLVRHGTESFADVDKVAHVRISDAKPKRFLQAYRACRALCRRPQVQASISFNPIPYGLLAARAARAAHKRCHFGFIGSDWNRDASGRMRFLQPLLREGDFITASGPPMRRAMVGDGFDDDRVRVLPHTVDRARYATDRTRSALDIVFVGRLHVEKRVDTILRGFARLLAKHPEATLTIVGDGPERERLHTLASDLQLGDAVDFVGYRSDVVPHLHRAGVLVMASEMEGFPFALVEGVCAGLVPVTTAVGDIGHHLSHDDTALFFDVGDDAGLAQRLDQLTDAALMRRLQANGRRLQASFGHEAATAVWDSWWSRWR